MKYRKKPVVIEAAQWYRLDPHTIFEGKVFYEEDSDRFYVVTIHGQRAYLAGGDWILPEPDGEHYYPCKPDIFEATYEAVE